MAESETESEDWEFPESLQPKQSALEFELGRALDAVMGLRARIPEDAYTANILGTERAGNAILIRDSGLVLTIGYLVTEAETIWLTTNAGAVVPATLVAYDFETGFGLVQALARLSAAPLEFGRARDLAVGQQIVFAGAGGRKKALAARLVGKREFAGYWEYVLDEALFTAPAHPLWGGGALLGPDGRLYGVGSLFVENARGGDQRAQGNMVVPIDLLPPILDELAATGRRAKPARPWLGFYATEHEDRIVVVGLAPRGPAAKAGLRSGDIVVDIAGAPVGSLADLFRTIWSVGPAGTPVKLALLRDGKRIDATVKSADRDTFLKAPRLH